MQWTLSGKTVSLLMSPVQGKWWGCLKGGTWPPSSGTALKLYQVWPQNASLEASFSFSGNPKGFHSLGCSQPRCTLHTSWLHSCHIKIVWSSFPLSSNFETLWFFSKAPVPSSLYSSHCVLQQIRGWALVSEKSFIFQILAMFFFFLQLSKSQFLHL